ncbi:MAG: flagellar hook-length control protein FliK [Actinomycetota bacterium]|nr:flagellar hook-length control protein FliK [Actinomycetota bacterium]
MKAHGVTKTADSRSAVAAVSHDSTSAPAATASVASQPAPVALRNDAVASVATAQPVPEAALPVHEQLAVAMAPLVDVGNGTHTLSLSLQPAGLGEVQARLVLSNGVVDVKLWASTHAGHQALGSALADLRQQLGGGGGSGGGANVDLASWGDKPAQQFQAPPDARTVAQSGHAANGEPVVPVHHLEASTPPDRLVDLRM